MSVETTTTGRFLVSPDCFKVFVDILCDLKVAEDVKLRGIWQYIPQSKTPVISIYRNRQAMDYFKTLNEKQQLSFARPNHISVVWDASVKPFKFNPNARKRTQMPRYFVEVKTIFKDGLFVVEEMLSEPTVKIPPFIKKSKQ